MELNISNWRPPEIASPDQMTQYPVDARGADWRNKDIGTLDLSGANLCRTDLRGANLSGCNMESVDMRLAKYDNNEPKCRYRNHTAISDIWEVTC